MTTRTRMLRSMPVWRTVATSRRAALLACAQVNPACSDLHALFANSLLRLFDISNRIDMNAYRGCHSASIQFADDSRLAFAADPIRAADRILKLVLPKHQQPAGSMFHRHKTIACRCFGK